jgi:hypothetical protein
MVLTTVNSAFDELLKRIELNPTRVQLVASRYKAIKERLESEIHRCEVFQIGSFQRKTKIRPDDENEGLDIDIGVCLNNFTEYAKDDEGVSPSQALNKVMLALEKDKTYKLMKPEKDVPTVTLEYSDGLRIEIVSCYRSVGRHFHRNSPPYCYIIGKDNNSWQTADYDYDAQVISGLNQVESVKQALVPSIKMVKRFLHNYRSPLKSFHVEVLCATIIPSEIIYWESLNYTWHYNHVLALFLSKAHELLKGPISLAGSYSVPVDSNINDQQMSHLGKILSQLGDRAWTLCKLPNSSSTIGQWAEFYGEPFPA